MGIKNALPKGGIDKVLEHYARTGNISQTARDLGLHRSTVQRYVSEAGKGKPLHAGTKGGKVKEQKRELPERGVKRYLVTCAQNNTLVWEPGWDSLMGLKAHYKAELLISRFTYNKAMFAYFRKPGTLDATDLDEAWYDEKVAPYICDDRVALAPGLVFCGEMNILPTAVRPLSGLETYTGRKSGIFPHAKLAMESVASVGDEPTKFNYTTGTVTKQNYITKKCGLKAMFHHTYGALLVEVDAVGNWWVRQLNADKNGVIYDLDVKADGCNVTEGHRVEAINWGDVHVEEQDPAMTVLNWGEGGIIDALKPKFQFMHDTESFRARNHHDRGNAHKVFEKYVNGQDSVEDELRQVTVFLNQTSARDYCQTVVVESNHDLALLRWLREADYRIDPVNAEIFLQLQKRMYQSIRERDTRFHLLEWVTKEMGLTVPVRFLRTDESYVICKDSGGGIESGIHGHDGPNGVRGSPLALSKMGRRANTGHTHSAGIIDGLYTSGTNTRRRVGFNKGPSSWSQSDIVTYTNGKRAIITKWQGKYRA